MQIYDCDALFYNKLQPSINLFRHHSMIYSATFGTKKKSTLIFQIETDLNPINHQKLYEKSTTNFSYKFNETFTFQLFPLKETKNE